MSQPRGYYEDIPTTQEDTMKYAARKLKANARYSYVCRVAWERAYMGRH